MKVSRARALFVLASLGASGIVAGTAGRPAFDSPAGGDTTVSDVTRNAYSLPARNLRDEHRPSFFVGNSFFNQNWVIAPASVAGRDGLGPLLNARSCSSCHFKDGRGRPPAAGEAMSTMLLRISVPGTDPHGGPRPEPVYGDQIQGQSVPGVRPEADVFVTYTEVAGAFADGETYSLLHPVYRLERLGYGPISTTLLTSPRVPPGIVGLGLLEAVPEQTLRQMSDPEDRNRDGISGRLNMVWSQVSGRLEVGRFGWKSDQPSVAQQTAAALLGDIGITSSIFRTQNDTPRQRLATGSAMPAPEASDRVLRAVTLYARTLAVPASRTAADSAAIEGRRLFTSLGCQSCHVAELRTGPAPDLPELADQTIRPFTDLLLHDMGPDLADNRPVFAASGREWRTPPLWGLGLLQKVNGHTFLLHDGRARNVTEAVLWHGGEASPSRDAFRMLPAAPRAALLAFLDSL